MMKDIINDLIAEQCAVDNLVSRLSEKEWMKPIPVTGTWNIKDAILHIAFFDYAAVRLIKGEGDDLSAFTSEQGEDPNFRPVAFHKLSGKDALKWWRQERTVMDYFFLNKDPKDRVPWAPGLPMSAKALASARQMELWAHSVDIYDSLGLEPLVEDRIAHTLFLSWQARPNAYRINGLKMPETPLYLEIKMPSGEIWAKGEPGAKDYIKGTAKDWALVSIRRRNVADTALEIAGDEARRYASIVQTYAGGADAAPAPKK